MMGTALTDAKVRLMINGPDVLDPRKYTKHHLKSHTRCDLKSTGPHKKKANAKAKGEKLEEGSEFKAKAQKVLLGKSSIF